VPVAVTTIAALGEGKTMAAKVDGVDVLVCNVEGQYYAVHGQCSHARQALSSGRLRGHSIICPLHGARFDVRSGDCLAAPAQRPIQTFPVTLEGGKVWVDVTQVEQPPKPKFGPIY